jgi:hypothetical protein
MEELMMGNRLNGVYVVVSAGLLLLTQAGCPSPENDAICQDLVACAEDGGTELPENAVSVCSTALSGLQIASPACYACIASADECDYDACEDVCGEALDSLGLGDTGDSE